MSGLHRRLPSTRESRSDRFQYVRDLPRNFVDVAFGSEGAVYRSLIFGAAKGQKSTRSRRNDFFFAGRECTVSSRSATCLRSAVLEPIPRIVTTRRASKVCIAWASAPAPNTLEGFRRISSGFDKLGVVLVKFPAISCVWSGSCSWDSTASWPARPKGNPVAHWPGLRRNEFY
jgi:hypothetical protein